tara:strand:- start:73166 stop:73354 length:189 start_codon:yes stop_codon:yes gene_type:complete
MDAAEEIAFHAGNAAARQSIISMIEHEAAKRSRKVRRLADILTAAIANRFDETDDEAKGEDQ